MVTAIKGNATSTFGGNVDVTGNVVTDAPAFRAISTTSQSLTANTWTKVPLSVESWDTNSNFDSSTNYRFTPTVSGYYQINVGYSFAGAAATNYTLINSIWKNGSEYIRGAEMNSVTGSYNQSIGAGLVYCNGTTDYIESYVIIIGGNINSGDTSGLSFMSGFLARAV